MIIEIIEARGRQIWIDGVKPTRSWVVGEDGQVGHWTDGQVDRLYPLEIGPHKLTKIAMLTEAGDQIDFNDDWDEDGRKPAYLAVHLEGGEILGPIKITFLVYGNGQSMTQLLVTTLDGKSHEIDEITTYIRAEAKP